MALIQLEIPDEEAVSLDLNVVRSVLRDALGVFVEQRQNPGVPGYVATRYAGMTEKFRTRKVAEVSNRVRTARVLRRYANPSWDREPQQADPLVEAIQPLLAAALPRCGHVEEERSGRLARRVARRVASWIRGEWTAGYEPEQLQEDLALQLLGDELPHCDHAVDAGLDHHEVADTLMQKVREVYPRLMAQLGDPGQPSS